MANYQAPNTFEFVPVSNPQTFKDISASVGSINRLFRDIYTRITSKTEFLRQFKRSGIGYSDLGILPVELGGTGLDNLKDAFTEMHNQTVLDAYADLNDIVAPGVYVATTDVAVTVVNAPESNPFSLYVTANNSGNRVVQLWVKNSASPTWYIRYNTSGGAWSSWMGISDTATEAAEAVKLKTARTIRTNLGSTSTASFDGTANVTPGVTGTLPIDNGGTGAATATGALANLFASAPTLNAISGYSGRATFDVGGYYQIGKLVIVQATLKVASTLGANANTMVGRDLPRPSSLIGISAALPDAKRTSAPVAATITTNGYLYLDRSGQLVSGDIIYLNGVYFAQ